MRIIPFVRQRSYGLPKERPEAPEGWVTVQLPPLPPEIASEVVRYARWRLSEHDLNASEGS